MRLGNHINRAAAANASRAHYAARVQASAALIEVSWLTTIAALVIATMIALAPSPVQSQKAVELVVVDVSVVARGYRATKLAGTTVVNDKDERIGSLDDIIIGRDRVLFAILQVGGFLGLGGHLVAVPYESLNIDDTGSKIVLPGASKEELKKLPEFKYRA